ncbi:MAG: division/cell wall cluster transcriptional repressor MraZ [Candidatus Colwellbacteria bacterium]
MFIGEFQHTIDEKGRIAVPAKFRTRISGGAIITRGLDQCLFIFTNKDWENFAQKLINSPSSEARANSRAFGRLMFSGASDAKLDSQGRILVPDYLRKYAGLDKSAKIIGVYNRMEIWDERTWDKYRERTEGSSDEIAEKMADLGI